MERKKSKKDEHDKALFNEINQIVNSTEVYDIINKFIPIEIISPDQRDKLECLERLSKNKAKTFINRELNKNFMAFAKASEALAYFYYQAEHVAIMEDTSFREAIKNTVKEQKTLVNNFKSTYEAFRHSVKRQLYL